MATQMHDVWLIRGSEFVRQQDPKFLAFSPMRTMFTEKVNQGVLITKDKGTSCAVLPKKIHGHGF